LEVGIYRIWFKPVAAFETFYIVVHGMGSLWVIRLLIPWSLTAMGSSHDLSENLNVRKPSDWLAVGQWCYLVGNKNKTNKHAWNDF